MKKTIHRDLRQNQQKILNDRDQKVQQEPQHSNGISDFQENRQKLQEECESYQYKQSSTCSSISRQLNLGILGTIWILTFSKGNLVIPNWLLIVSLILCIVFLLVDMFHYYLDSRSYHKESYRLDEYKTQDDLDNIHEPYMDRVNRRSHKFFIAKFIIMSLAAISFICGIIMHTC